MNESWVDIPACSVEPADADLRAEDISQGPIKRVLDYEVRINDADNFRVLKKDVFDRRIYHFDCDRGDPLILDCGSNIGMSVLYFKSIYPAARITAFEPDPTVVRFIRENLRRNNIHDVRVIEAALSPGVDKQALQSDGKYSSCLMNHAPTGVAARDTSCFEVACVRLRDYLKEPIDFLKMNIEGAEWEVLADSEDRLHNVESMVIEYHHLPGLPRSLHKILALLDAQGFEYLINDFDAETNPKSQPPFRLTPGTRYYLLIYARRRSWVNNSIPPLGVTPNDRSPADRERDIASTVGDQPFGSLHRLEPISRVFGIDRGQCIDRYYIKKFLARYAGDIHGRVLEVADRQYTQQFGGDRVTQSDVLHAVEGNRKATIVGDLTQPDAMPHDAFDCIILTQTLQHIYNLRAAIQSLHQMLKPGGVLLATVPGISQISRYDMDRWGDFWRFTTVSATRVFQEAFELRDLTVEAFGNVLISMALLQGLSAEELTIRELDHRDPDYELLITVRACKSKSAKL